MTNNISESRNFKIYGILWSLSVCYALLHHFVNQTHFARFPPMFNVYMELILNDYIGQNLSNAANHAIATGSSFSFFQYLDLFLYFITGLDPYTLLIIPIGSILLPIWFFILIRSIFVNYTTLGLLVNIYLVIYTISFKYFRASYVDVFAFTAFLIMLYCLKKIQDEDFHHNYSLIALIMLTFLVGAWHTMAFISTIFVVSIMFVYFAIKLLYTKILKSQCQCKLKTRTAITLYSIILLFTFKFDKLTPYAKSFFNDGFDIFTFIQPFLRKLSGAPTHSLKLSSYQYIYLESFWGKVYFYSNLLIYIVAAFISILSILYFFRLILNKKGINYDLEVGFLFIIASLLSQIMFSFLYSKTATGFFYVPYTFPIFGAYLLEKLGKKRIAIISMIFLIALSFSLSLSSHLTNENETTPLTKYHDTEPSFSWFYIHNNINTSVYADFSILYKFLALEVQRGLPSIDYIDITSNQYGYIVGDLKPNAKDHRNYVLIDYASMSANKPVNTYESRGLLVPKLRSINNNPYLNKVYLDAHVGIYQYI